MQPWIRSRPSFATRTISILATTVGPTLALTLALVSKSVSAPVEQESVAIEAASPTPLTTLEASPQQPAEESGLKSLIRSIAPGFFEDDGAQGADPTVMETEAGDLVNPLELLSESELKAASPWQPTDFSGQSGMLGWSESTFDVPKRFAERVGFWRDIYTKYTSDQGVLHDRDHFDLLYEQIDFTSIMQNPKLTVFQKARARERFVKERRNELIARFKRLATVKTESELSGEDLRIWKLFSKVEDKDKFKLAAARGRIRFQLGQRDRFIVGIYHSGRYLRQMEKTFREEGLPIELTRLPFVESSFNIHARSRVGASGVWQFMKRTARPYLKVGQEVDERNDPLKATRASARLLKSNYEMLQSWPLAITGYNHGPNGVRNITNKLGTRDLVEIVNTYSSRRFGFASENFYACFLAALEVERNAKKFFGDVRWGPEITGSEVKLKMPLTYKTVLDFFDGDKATAELYNPHLNSRVRKGRAQVPKGTFVRVPAERAKLIEELQDLPSKQVSKFLSENLSARLKELPLQVMSPAAITPAPEAAPSPANP